MIKPKNNSVKGGFLIDNPHFCWGEREERTASDHPAPMNSLGYCQFIRNFHYDLRAVAMMRPIRQH